MEQAVGEDSWGVVQARPTGKMRGFEACSAYLSTTMIHGD